MWNDFRLPLERSAAILARFAESRGVGISRCRRRLVLLLGAAREGKRFDHNSFVHRNSVEIADLYHERSPLTRASL